MPSAAAQVIQLVQDPSASIASLRRAIELDPGLTSNVLRLANSAYLGSPRSVRSVRDALVRLGTNRVFQLVIAAAVAPVAQQTVRGYDLPPGALWHHSVAVAVGTTELAAAAGRRPPDHAFTAGLLHDIGKIVLGTFLEVDAAPIMQLAFEEHLSFELAEQRILGIHHAELGARVLEGWHLPPPIVEVVRWHHQPESYPGDTLVVDLVHMADALALVSGIGAGSDGLNYRPSAAVLSRLRVTTAVAEGVVCRMLDGLRELRELFCIAS
jgi:putative nucleotidyltransferase with HDIG domain